jgi:hypothetical protein
VTKKRFGSGKREVFGLRHKKGVGVMMQEGGSDLTQNLLLVAPEPSSLSLRTPPLLSLSSLLSLSVRTTPLVTPKPSFFVTPSNDGVRLVKDAILLVVTRWTPSFDGVTKKRFGGDKKRFGSGKREVFGVRHKEKGGRDEARKGRSG